jgi:hypothetical protein
MVWVLRTYGEPFRGDDTAFALSFEREGEPEGHRACAGWNERSVQALMVNTATGL